jgi:hypothetical protein
MHHDILDTSAMSPLLEHWTHIFTFPSRAITVLLRVGPVAAPFGSRP